MSPWRDNSFHRALRWVSTAGVFALAPKCVLCLGAYASVGAWVGIKAGPEICGESTGIAGASVLWLAFLTTTVATSVITWSKVLCGCFRSRASVAHHSPALGR